MSQFDETRPLTFSEHDDEQGLERNISRHDALHVLRNPSKTESALRGCHNVWGYTTGGKRIRLTINVQTNVVITLANADRRQQ